LWIFSYWHFHEIYPRIGENFAKKSRRVEGKNLRAAVGPQPLGWGVVDSKFLRAASPILSKFYALRGGFFRCFFGAKKAANILQRF